MNDKIKIYDGPNDDSELWENGTYGQSEEFVRACTPAESRAVDRTLGLVEITLRLDMGLLLKLKQKARLAGIGFLPMVRRILAEAADK